MAGGSIVFIVNPRAGNGSVGKMWPGMAAGIRHRFGRLDARLTEYPGHAVSLARKAVLAGTGTVVCVGGDGTLNEVVNGVMAACERAGQGPLLGFIPRGTGGDLRRTVPVPSSLGRSLDLIESSRSRHMDLGRIISTDHEGGRTARYFHNVLSFGLGGEVDARVNRTTKMFGGFLSFIWATLASLFTYTHPVVRLAVDDGAPWEAAVLNVAVANGQYHGGGMRVAPGARVDDGLFQVTVIGDLSLPDVLRSLPLLYSGRIYEHPKVTRMQGRRVAASSGQRVLLDMDGEQPGRLPALIEMVPSAARIICETSG